MRGLVDAVRRRRREVSTVRQVVEVLAKALTDTPEAVTVVEREHRGGERLAMAIRTGRGIESLHDSSERFDELGARGEIRAVAGSAGCSTGVDQAAHRQPDHRHEIKHEGDCCRC
mgnify:CR=1 FL=1